MSRSFELWLEKSGSVATSVSAMIVVGGSLWFASTARRRGYDMRMSLPSSSSIVIASGSFFMMMEDGRDGCLIIVASSL